MSKVVFIDVDGTLVDYEGNLPESAVSAIRKARENGHHVYICTGRSRAEVYQNIWDIGLDGMIGANGAYVEHNGQVVMHKGITKDECSDIVNWLKERNLEFYLESNSGLYASENFEEAGTPVIKKYAQRKGAKDMTVREAFPDMIFDEKNLVRDDVNKISFILSKYEDYLEAKEHFKNFEVNTWGGKGETALFGDLGVKGINKADAVVCILNTLKADVSDTIAIGDAKIDIPMLEYCNVGVAMGNGGEEIKEVADIITDSVENDGLYNAFERLGLI
ncbi:MAG: HAD family hydrolase [Tyzzerella sp.]|uniref:HAD family hydrolase n=1 Tax=Candidatus Fimicola merdigallinarum TaxID=2840819 RepID=A0A9D9DW43_9FIRM|nr:HAD family hydrolase [Candidatus Fimicola merdigallinarum]